MKAVFRDYGIALLLALALVVGSFLQGCAAAPPPVRVGIPGKALVELVRLETHPRETWGTDPGWIDLAPRWAPYCSAFGVKRLGRVQLATAAHCVPEGASEVSYRQTLGVAKARVSYISEARDVAYLDPMGETPQTIERAQVLLGSRVRAFTSGGAVSDGRVTADYVLGFFETSTTIRRGWSGSPVVDDDGRAIGLVAKCQTGGGLDCAPGNAIVARLP